MKIIKNIISSSAKMAKTSISSVISFITSTRKRYFIQLYQTIDELPLLNYIMALETGDTNHLRRKYKKSRITFYDELENIHIELIEKFGLPAAQKDILLKRRELLLLRIEYYQTGIRDKLMLIKNISRELEEVNTVKPLSITKTLARINSHKGTSYTVRALTVREYYDIVDEYNKEIEQAKVDQVKKYG